MRRSLALGVVLLVGLTGTLSTLTAAPVVAATTASTGTSSTISSAGRAALADVAQCLASNPNLVAELVVDESGSLQDTDPKNKRAEILASVVRSFGQFAGQKLVGKPRRVDLAVSLFAEDYTRLVPWTTLDRASTDRIADKLRSELPGANRGQLTNHPKALAGARRDLANGANRFAAEVPPCKVMFMFTDGELNVYGTRAVSENEQAGADMCRVRGVVDGLRSDDVFIGTVLLFDRSQGAPNAQQARGFERLRATGEGLGAGLTCGTVPIPKSYQAGAYFEGGVDALAGLFGAALARGAGGTQVPATGSPTNLRVDAGVRSFRIVARAPGGFTLAAPNGSGTIQIQQGQGGSQIAGVDAAVTWTDSTATIDVPIAGPQGQGVWTFTRQGVNDDFGFFLFSGLQIQLDDGELVADESVTLNGRVVDQSGSPAPLSVYGVKQLFVKSLDANGNGIDVPFTLNDDGTFTGSFTPRSDSTSTTFDVTLKLTTVPSQPGTAGLDLDPVVRQFVQPVRLGTVFPQIAPATLTLSTLQGKDDTSRGSLTLTGSPDGPTRICLGDAVLSELDNPQQFVIDGDGQCVDLAANETKSIEITARNSAESVDAQVKGQIPLKVTGAATPVASAPSRDVALPLSFLSVRPIDQVKRGIEFFLLLLAGLLIPWLVLFLANKRAARLSLAGIQAARVPVRITGLDEDLVEGTLVAFIRPGTSSADAAIQRLNSDLALSPTISESLTEARGTRDPQGAQVSLARTDGGPTLLSLEDFGFVRSPGDRVTSWRPGPEEIAALTPGVNVFGSIRGQVRVPEGTRVASSQVPRTIKGGQAAGMSLDPAGEFYLLVPVESPISASASATGSTTGQSPFGPGAGTASPPATGGPGLPPPPPSPF